MKTAHWPKWCIGSYRVRLLWLASRPAQLRGSERGGQKDNEPEGSRSKEPDERANDTCGASSEDAAESETPEKFARGGDGFCRYAQGARKRTCDTSAEGSN